MGLLERIGRLLDVVVAEEEQPRARRAPADERAAAAASVASLVAAYHEALLVKADEGRLAFLPVGEGEQVAELVEVEGREFRLGVVTGGGKEQRTVEKVVRASDRDAALQMARAVWPAAVDVVVVDEGNDGGES